MLQKEIIAIDDSKAALARIKKVAANLSGVAVRTFETEEEALEMISNYRKGKSLPVFFIDLNVTDNDSGYRILTAIRRKPSLRLVPVVIVSNSNDDDAIHASYKLGANAYHIKRNNDELKKVVCYWIKNDQDKSVINKRYA